MSKKEGRYYVEYLGWKEARGLYGREFTEPIVRELLARRRQSDVLPKMTIKVSRQELQISQEQLKRSSSKREKVRYPAIPIKDVTFVVRGLYPDTDVAACIFLGYNPYTKCAVHIHVYRFDSENTASMFVDHLSSIISLPEYKQRIIGIEKDLCDLGHTTMRRSEGNIDAERTNGRRPGSDGYSYGTPSPHSSDGLSPKYPTMEAALRSRTDIHIVKTPKQEPDKNVKRIFSSLQEEFEYKVQLNDTALLLPPKDYDTVVRRHGHLDIRDQSKSTERSIIGPNGIFKQSEGELYKSRVDEAVNGNSTAASDNLNVSENSSNNDTIHDKSYVNNNYLKPEENGGLRRSHSDTQANLQRPSSMQRQSSQASSDRGSANSDEYYADGLYQGYKPFKKSKSRPESYNSFVDDQLDMAMWSPSFSFGQTGAKRLQPHAEEENDTLSKTAPSGFLPRQQMPRSANYKKQNVKRSNSHQLNGQIRSRQYH